MKVHHIGYAVKDINGSINVFESLGYKASEIVKDDLRKVNICFMEKDGYVVELISPISKDVPSVVDGVLKKSGNTPYHICYEVPNLKEAIDELKEKNFKAIIPPQEACAIEGRNVCFLFNKDIGIIEIVEE